MREILGEGKRASDIEALAELLAADSEWRWRKAGFSEKVPASAGCDWHDPRPRFVETYLAEMPELTDSLESVRMLIESEFMARSRWGNPPTITEFVDRFPYVEGLDSALRQSLDELCMVYVTIRRQSGSLGADTNIPESVSVPVITPLSIGRQAMSEPRDTLLMPDRRRLIVVDNYQHGVSRQHAVVIRQAIDRCWVANVSPLGWMKVNDRDMQPGARQMYILPIKIEIGPVELKVFAG